MVDLLIAYAFFVLKIVTVLIAVLIPILIISSSSRQKKEADKGRIVVKNLSERLEEIGVSLKSAEMNPKSYKNFLKKRSKKKKKDIKNKPKEIVYVLEFQGDIQASGVDRLKQEINAIIFSQVKCKEVVLKVESTGGSAYAYGLCAAELKRLIDHKIKLTVCCINFHFSFFTKNRCKYFYFAKVFIFIITMSFKFIKNRNRNTVFNS